MDDDVMDQQKYASAAMVLARALVNIEKDMQSNYDSERGHILPEVPLPKARQIMTRADFIRVGQPPSLPSYLLSNVFSFGSRTAPRPLQSKDIC